MQFQKGITRNIQKKKKRKKTLAILVFADKDIHKHVYTSICIHIYIYYMCEREREMERKTLYHSLLLLREREIYFQMHSLKQYSCQTKPEVLCSKTECSSQQSAKLVYVNQNICAWKAPQHFMNDNKQSFFMDSNKNSFQSVNHSHN